MSLFHFEQEEERSHIPVGTYRQRLYEEARKQQPQEESPNSSFGGRFLLCIFLLSGYLFLSADMKQEIRSYVKSDYSKNVFDFITELSYTLDYEEISVK